MIGVGNGETNGSGPWQVFTASAVGAYHIRAGNRTEDAVATARFGPGEPGSFAALAVADGHGHSRHFRSDRGSAMAVAEAISAAVSWAQSLPDRSAITNAATRQLVADIIARWRASVAADLAADPIGPEQASSVSPEDPAEIPYGSTLLLTVLLGNVAVLAQIGDGDMVLIGPDGQYVAPVPGDSRLDGRQTTSLCQPDAHGAFRVAVADLTATPAFAIFAATDGYGNAQAEEDWQAVFAADLVRLAIKHGAGWLGGQLDAWTEVCASAEGSGDDSTAALAINTGLVGQLTAAPPRRARASGTTEPARLTVPAADGWLPPVTVPAAANDKTLIERGGTLADPDVVSASRQKTLRAEPGDWPPGSGAPADPGPDSPPKPARRPRARLRRRNVLLLAGLVVVIVAVVVVFLLRSHSPKPSGPGLSRAPAPSASAKKSGGPGVSKAHSRG
jgi:Protein phosphatase 2C